MDNAQTQTNEKLKLPPIPVPGEEPARTALGKWMQEGESLGSTKGEVKTHPWYMVIWLTGVDLFSSLGFQPGLALLAAGILSPIATLVLVAVTLFGILPVYCRVAERSYTGQGSIALLENFLKGWVSKLFVLILLGFASTDFVITTTLAAADAARHLVANPYFHAALATTQIPLTLVLILILAGVFLAGFTEALGVSIAIVVPYLVLTLIVVLRSGVEIFNHPEFISHWRLALASRESWSGMLLASCIVFPQLALGLSGFETGVSVMPFIKGSPSDGSDPVPKGRIGAAKKLLTTAAVLISLFLVGTSVVTTLLIPEAAYRAGGAADGRALAYLAHGLLGNGLGTVYDFSTILILWFTGASAIAGMLSLISRYLPRFGMAPRWVAYYRPLVIVVTIVDIIVTLVFKANVDAQSGAFATGVLTLFLSAAAAGAMALWREAREASPPRVPWGSLYTWLVTLVLFYTLVQNIHERPDGLIISSIFILTILATSALSRLVRATELRVESVTFTDDESSALWDEMAKKKVDLIPLHRIRQKSRREKAAEIRRLYNVTRPFAFLHVTLRDDRSEFESDLKLSVRRLDDDYLIEVAGAVAVANTIAYLSELLKPYAIFLRLTRRNPVLQAVQYLLFGQGDVGIMVYEILARYWDWRPPAGKRPFIFLESD